MTAAGYIDRCPVDFGRFTHDRFLTATHTPKFRTAEPRKFSNFAEDKHAKPRKLPKIYCYTPLHPYTRRIMDSDSGETILCVRGTRFLHKWYTCMSVGPDHTMKIYRYNDGNSDLEIVPAALNNSNWIVWSEIPNDVKDNCYTCQEPKSAAVSAVFLEPTCAVCLRQNSTKVCSGCKIVHYCSVACQRADWKLHKLSCL